MPLNFKIAATTVMAKNNTTNTATIIKYEPIYFFP